MTSPVRRGCIRTQGVAAAALLVVAAACDLPTSGVDQGRGHASVQRATVRHDAGRGRYGCLTSVRTSNGGPPAYRYRRVRGIELPDSVEAGGRTVVLRLTFQSPGEPVFAQVNCRIPATAAAARLIRGTFVRSAQPGLSPPGGSTRATSSRSDLFVEPRKLRIALPTATGAALAPRGPLMDYGCVTAGSCALPPIGEPVSPYPAGSYTNPYDACYWGCGWNASAADNGGGSGYDPGTPEDDADDALMQDDHDTIPTLVPNCGAPQPGSEYARCHSFTPVPGSDLDSKTRAALARIAQRGAQCAAIAAMGYAMLERGTLGFFYGSQAPSQYGRAGGYGGPWGALLDYDYWMRYYDGADRIGRTFDNGLAHEIEHAMGVQHVSETARYPTTPNAFACGG